MNLQWSAFGSQKVFVGLENGSVKLVVLKWIEIDDYRLKDIMQLSIFSLGRG